MVRFGCYKKIREKNAYSQYIRTEYCALAVTSPLHKLLKLQNGYVNLKKAKENVEQERTIKKQKSLSYAVYNL